ncbi:MAG: two-component sensor histidine kinase, partial [Propionibacteriales bacterium]|nr:two-component sensor histidine kinase [Propionibacteriales bacterium]
LAYRTDLSVDEIQRTSSIIQENAHRALVDLRVVLGILRDGPDDSAPELPQPSISDLASLIAEARSTGLTIDFTCSIDSASVTEMTGRTAYRVVQEGLTNARKHAPDTDVQVRVSGTASDGLNVVVSNPLRIGSHRLAAPPSGLGLIGLAERVELAGGRLHHEVTAEREFVLEAWLPWQP